ncbi:MAG: hypothetical protein ACYTHJ_07765 [Planctomycetota bacterium]|jgi:hypothetical protein
MANATVQANSLAEAYYHLMILKCLHCKRGTLKAGDAIKQHDDPAADGSDEPTTRMAIDVQCQTCGESATHQYQLPHGLGTAVDGSPPVVNPTNTPSTLIDVAQWVSLFSSIAVAAAETKDRGEARRLGLEAAQCLEEALKFYDDDESDLPPAASFFHDDTRERLKSNPELFSRHRLLDLRSKLPSDAVMRSRITEGEQEPRSKKRWWKPW